MAELVLYINGEQEVLAIVERLTAWTSGGYEITLTNASRALAEKVKDDMRSGLEYEGRPMYPLAPATLEGPIRREGHDARRGDYGSVPLKATGQLIDDIVGIKVSANEYEVTAFSDEGQMKLSSNARGGYSKSPFAGNVSKPRRDPLQASEGRFDIVEQHILSAIEKAIGI